jgi:hypothetical protein
MWVERRLVAIWAPQKRQRALPGEMYTRCTGSTVLRSRVTGGAHVRRQPHGQLRESEGPFADFVALTPCAFTPFVKSFDSHATYERSKRAQKNSWYR